jgi:hypothetical protein
LPLQALAWSGMHCTQVIEPVTSQTVVGSEHWEWPVHALAR